MGRGEKGKQSDYFFLRQFFFNNKLIEEGGGWREKGKTIRKVSETKKIKSR